MQSTAKSKIGQIKCVTPNFKANCEIIVLFSFSFRTDVHIVHTLFYAFSAIYGRWLQNTDSFYVSWLCLCLNAYLTTLNSSSCIDSLVIRILWTKKAKERDFLGLLLFPLLFLFDKWNEQRKLSTKQKNKDRKYAKAKNNQWPTKWTWICLSI